MRQAFLLSAVALVLFCAAPAARAQSAAEDEAAIRAAITAQAAAWNRGDIPEFMKAYDDSPDTTFIGLTRRKGFQPIQERYRQTYSTREQMGTLTFSDIDVRLLPGVCGKTEIALATGQYHLDNTTQPKKDGVFSLVWRKGPHGWKIVLDHTS